VTFNVNPVEGHNVAAAWGADRDAMYNAARLALNIHQDGDMATLPPLRLVVAAAYRLPFLSETVADQGTFAGRIITEDYHHLIDRVPYWLAQDLTGYADALHALLCEDWTFAKSVEANL